MAQQLTALWVGATTGPAEAKLGSNMRAENAIDRKVCRCGIAN